jgi:predicted Zn-dependent protease
MNLVRRGMAWLTGCVLLLAAACTPVVNPVTGETQYTALSQADEIKMGREEHPKVLAEYGGAYADQKLQAYVVGIGNRLAKASDVPDEKFTFTLLDSDIVNAFALPGGYVYVSRGLLALADNEAELAGVLGHEIGHVAARHTAQRVTQQQYGQVGTLLATVLGGALLGDTGAQLGQQLGGAGTAAWVQGYSRSQELEADQLGVKYLARAGYDPHAMATFLGALEANDKLQAKLKGTSDAQAAPSWLASHPRTEDRIVQAADAAANAQGGGEIDRDRFLGEIDGLVWGDSPDQGFVRGRTFIHPVMKIEFTAPSGFQLQNGPSAVLGQDGSGRAMIFDADKGGRGDMAAYLQQDWAKKPLQDVQRLTVNGRPAAIGFAQVSIGGSPGAAMLAAIDGGDTIYRFIYAKRGGLGQGDIADFQQSLESFGTPSAADLAKARARRIEVVKVASGDTLQSLADRMDVDQLKQDYFITLNGPDAVVPGQKVKLIEQDSGGPGA